MQTIQPEHDKLLILFLHVCGEERTLDERPPLWNSLIHILYEVYHDVLLQTHRRG